MGSDSLVAWEGYKEWCKENGQTPSVSGFDAWLYRMGDIDRKRIDVV